VVDQGGRDPDTSKVIKGRRRHHQLNAGCFAWACILGKAYCSQVSISKAIKSSAGDNRREGEPRNWIDMEGQVKIRVAMIKIRMLLSLSRNGAS